MDNEKDFQPKFEKPRVLYHASRAGDIAEFEPRADKSRDEHEGPRVFAAPSRAIASLFLVDTDGSWVSSGTLEDIPFIVISDEERFRLLDQGAYMYELSSDTFETDPEKGLQENEWTSSESVAPIDKQFIPSAVEYMLEQGVLVYFVDQETWIALQESGAGEEEFLKALTPLSRHT